MAINLGQPVNWGHPLNHGRVAWFKSIPGASGRQTLINLASKKNGTLSGTSWIGPRLQPSYQLLSCNGSSDYVSFSDNTTFPTSGSFTLSIAVKFVSSGSVFSWSNPGGAARLIDISLQGLGNARFQLYDGGNNPYTDGTSDLSVNRLHLVTCVRDSGSTIYLYVNGVLENSTSDTAASNLDSGSQSWRLFNRQDSSSFGGCLADDASAWNRALSANEVKVLYREWLCGYPNALNRTKPGFITSVSAPAGLAANPLFGGGAAANPLWGYVA